MAKGKVEGLACSAADSAAMMAAEHGACGSRAVLAKPLLRHDQPHQPCHPQQPTWLPMCSRSGKPFVTSSAQRSPLRSSSAFVATVVPMRMLPMREVSSGWSRGWGMPGGGAGRSGGWSSADERARPVVVAVV